MTFLSLLFLAGAALALPAPQKGGGNATCNSVLTAQLVGGIQANLNIQAQELQGVQTLASLTAANSTGRALPNNAVSDFQLTQSNVLTIQQKGIDIRAQNQKLASELNSPAAQGLAVVAMAQVMEVMQVKSLTGSGPADAKTLQLLVTEVQGGTKQNMMNLMAAESACKKA
ncbi:hypothetical protein K504DRAFT_493942 [Pleomassaria siparia CBS 279.74]|uniref:Cell wall protein n=1 Tax=Pleomassaria siparia CBS 279.74 TaxID=1314801 RepID=A0A6G1JY14_9PLEO|nr:hypothetical protein K504DRAFT_493942 [Pleomassaria siparia CBS 279.74]